HARDVPEHERGTDRTHGGRNAGAGVGRVRPHGLQVAPDLRDQRRRGRPHATRNITLFPAACGEKKRVTSSSKKVSPVAPRSTAYAARYAFPPSIAASSCAAR